VADLAHPIRYRAGVVSRRTQVEASLLGGFGAYLRRA